MIRFYETFPLARFASDNETWLLLLITHLLPSSKKAGNPSPPLFSRQRVNTPFKKGQVCDPSLSFRQSIGLLHRGSPFLEYLFEFIYVAFFFLAGMCSECALIGGDSLAFQIPAPRFRSGECRSLGCFFCTLFGCAHLPMEKTPTFIHFYNRSRMKFWLHELWVLLTERNRTLAPTFEKIVEKSRYSHPLHFFWENLSLWADVGFCVFPVFLPTSWRIDATPNPKARLNIGGGVGISGKRRKKEYYPRCR